HHLLEEFRQPQVRALVPHIADQVSNYVSQDVEADEIDGAKGRRLGPSHRRSGERIDLFDGEIHLLHQAHYVEDGEGPIRLAMKLGVSLARTMPLPRCR